MVDVVVVGAGPAGASTGYHLATHGWRVLVLDKAVFPRDKACGDAVTATSLQLLKQMGVQAELRQYRRIRGLRIVLNDDHEDRLYGRGDGTRVDHGITIPRYQLDELILRQAVSAGAEIRQGVAVKYPLFEAGRVGGVRVWGPEGEADIHAQFVVAADGANSGFARQAGLRAPGRRTVGFAMRGYFTHPQSGHDLYAMYVPLADPCSSRSVGGYGWLFPIDDNTANIGVGFFPADGQDQRVNLRLVFDGFVRYLEQSEPACAGMRMNGQVRGAPLAFGLDPEQCAGDGVLTVGDAAGLVDPFTGEGIHTALDSGRIAAEMLSEALSHRNPRRTDLREYGRLLEARYGARFQLGRKHVRIYGFAWKLLGHTTDVERPVCRGIRRAMLDEGLGLSDGASLRDTRRIDLLNDSFLCADYGWLHQHVEEKSRSDVPLLSSVYSYFVDGLARSYRLALFLIGSQFGPRRGRDNTDGAVALELACLAFALHGDVDNVPVRMAVAGYTPRSAANWSNTFALMLGNHLLTQSHLMASKLSSAPARTVFIRASRDLSLLKVHEAALRQHEVPTSNDYIRLVARQTGLIFGAAAALGASMSGASVTTTRHLQCYGHNLGIAFHLTRAEVEVHLMERVSDFGQSALGCASLLPHGEPRFLLSRLAEPYLGPDWAMADAEPAIVVETMERGATLTRNGVTP